MDRCPTIKQGGLVRRDRVTEKRSTFWLCVALGLAMALPQQTIDAQSASRLRLGEIQPDSAAWRPLLVYIIAKLSHNVLDAAIDTIPRPWKMSFPSTGANWTAIESHLRKVLRARPVVSGDSVVYELRIHDLTVSADTARVQVITSVTWDCPRGARQGGYTNRDDVFAFRFATGPSQSPTVWSAARTAGVLHGDRFGCPERRP